MKKLLISIVLLSQGIGAGVKIEPVSLERVAQFQAELDASEKKRDTQFKWAVGGVGAAVLTGFIVKLYRDDVLDLKKAAKAWSNRDKYQKTIKKAKKKLAKKGRKAAQAYNKAQEGRLDSQEWLASLPGYLWSLPGALFSKIKDGAYAVPELALDAVRATPSTIRSIAGGGVGHGKSFFKDTAKYMWKNAPGYAGMVGLAYLATQAGKFLLPAIPSIGDYFLEVRSIKWCLVKHSDFYNVMVNFKNWIGYEQSHGYQATDTIEITLCGNHLVLEVERILGYMAYVTKALDADVVGYSFYEKRAEACMNALTTEANALADEINVLTTVELEPAQKKAFVELLRKRLFRIVTQLESFEVVTSAADMASPYEEDVFGPLKRFIYPEWNLDRPELQDPNRNILTDIFEQMEQEV